MKPVIDVGDHVRDHSMEIDIPTNKVSSKMKVLTQQFGSKIFVFWTENNRSSVSFLAVGLINEGSAALLMVMNELKIVVGPRSFNYAQ